MEWNKLLYTLIVVVLYIPVVFMGANVFFPDLEHPENDCFRKSVVKATDAEKLAQEKCLDEHRDVINKFEAEKEIVDGWKYVFVVVVSLVALLAALFITLDSSITMGLFLGAAIASFFSTWIYFESRSIIGFIVLIVIFIGSLVFIQRNLLKPEKKRR